MLRFALVGCGRIAKRHAEILGNNQIEGAGLSAVCDLDVDKAASFSGKYSAPYFTDYHQMMREMGDDIDVVSILTPSGLHARHCLDLCKYGKHLLVEKPMALQLSDADKMILACKKEGVKLFIVKQNRYNLPVLKLREALLDGRFGKLVMGTVRVRWCRDQNYYDRDPWRGTWALDGGVFANQASHHIDLLGLIMGEVESVYALSKTALVNVEVEDSGLAILCFKSGALGSIEATTAARPKDIEGSISVLGEKGLVEIGGFAVNEIKQWNFANSCPGDKNIDQYDQKPHDIYGFGHIDYLRDVVISILENKPEPVDGQEGRKSLRLISAIYRSIECGKEVFLSESPCSERLGVE